MSPARRAEARALGAVAEGLSDDPFAVLGRHPAPAGGPAGAIIRTLQPAASAVDLVAGDRVDSDGAAAPGRAVRRRRAVGRAARGARLPPARARGRRACATWWTPTSSGPSSPTSTCISSRRARTTARGSSSGRGERTVGLGERRALRRVGAERAARQRDRRLQPVGRPRPRDAPAGALGRLGDLRARACTTAPATSSRCARATGTCWRRRTRTRARFETPPQTASVVSTGGTYVWGDGEWMRAARGARRVARAADVDLRGAPRLVAAA